MEKLVEKTIVTMIFIRRYSFSNFHGWHLWMKAIVIQLSDLCSEALLPASSAKECYTINCAAILARDYHYQFCMNFLYLMLFLIV